ncbi:PREDICTED: uncharacterized protein LOC109337366 [Lupinus angustifolius]|uniref:uncharacterized protein LOC109337366 n=1 Tax=Lupinus angustifolius TaxID=3871 RepID=UPI00092F4FAC|nr:PREDICTED: uncharacterized protein LOC109337366 [Lupinus angustifolius]
MYASRSRVRIMALKQHITTFSKGTQPVATYLQGIKAIVDELSIIDHHIDNTDLVIHTLNGLSNDYKEISAALCIRETPIIYAELHEKLMDFESILQRDINTNFDTMVATENATLCNRGQPRYRSHLHEQTIAHTTHSKLVCQYCERPGHSAKKCYKIDGYPRKSGPRPSVNMAHHQPTMQNSSWILDTRASHHVTSDL